MLTVIGGALIGLILLGLLAKMVERLWRLLARLIGAVLLLASMGVVAGASVIASRLLQEEDWAGLAVVLAVACASVWFAWILFRRLRRLRDPNRPHLSGRGPDRIAPVAAAPPLPSRIEGSQDRDRLLALMKWGERRRARQAWAKLDALLMERDSASLTSDHRALILSLEKRIPELTQETLRRCEQALAAERRAYMAKMLATLEGLAADAASARAAIRAADDFELETLHRYFENNREAPAAGS